MSADDALAPAYEPDIVRRLGLGFGFRFGGHTFRVLSTISDGTSFGTAHFGFGFAQIDTRSRAYLIAQRLG